MKVVCLGSGTWGFCLASLLASKGHEVTVWSRNRETSSLLSIKRQHPKLSGYDAPSSIVFTSDLSFALDDKELIVESVTSTGIRPVFTQILQLRKNHLPIVITSKGIEKESCFLPHEILLDILGNSSNPSLGYLSGPTLAEEVLRKAPTSVVCSSNKLSLMEMIQNLFTTPFFRVYQNSDMQGVGFGGAMKNVIAIAAGISDGLGFGDNTKAFLITRGLNEIRNLSRTKGAQSETLNGLAGMGDLCVTCLSKLSRNYKFGNFIAQGLSVKEAQSQIGMVVEGWYTSLSAMMLARSTTQHFPILQAVYDIVHNQHSLKTVIESLLSKSLKTEYS